MWPCGGSIQGVMAKSRAVCLLLLAVAVAAGPAYRVSPASDVPVAAYASWAHHVRQTHAARRRTKERGSGRGLMRVPACRNVPGCLYWPSERPSVSWRRKKKKEWLGPLVQPFFSLRPARTTRRSSRRSKELTLVKRRSRSCNQRERERETGKERKSLLLD